MRTPTIPLGLAAAMLALVACGAVAESYSVSVSCQATLSVPVAADATTAVHIRDSAGNWHITEAIVQDGRLVLHLDPAQLGGSRALVLVNPPADMDITDVAPPTLSFVRVDREFLQALGAASMQPSVDWPRRVAFAVEDGENALDEASVRVALDGEPIRERVRVEQIGPKTLWVRAKLPKADYGEHVISYRVSDASPQQNAFHGEVRFGRYDLTNYALAARGATITTDSAFSGYDSLQCLQDGDTPLPGNSLPGTISWASAETDAPHWVQVDFGQARTVKEVTLYWANYSDRLNTSTTVQVQIPEGQGWKAVYQSPQVGEEPARCTTFEFDPVTVSKLRVWQPGGGGGALRPNLMWLTEVEAR